MMRVVHEAALPICALMLVLLLLRRAMLRYRVAKRRSSSDPTQPQSTDHTQPQSTASIVCEDSKPGLIYLRWPVDAQYPEFEIEYTDVARRLAAAKQPYGLVHDLRGSDLSPMYGHLYDKVQADANEIALLGMVASCAIVLDVGPILRATISLLTHALSPVPTRVFSDSEAACAWVAGCSMHPQKTPVEDTATDGLHVVDGGFLSESNTSAPEGDGAPNAWSSFTDAISRCLPHHSCLSSIPR